MSGYQKGSNYYDNAAFDKGADNDYDGSIPVEPAPRQFLPRIITGSEFGGQKPKSQSSAPPVTSVVPVELVGSPQSPRFQSKSGNNGEQTPLATISQNVDDPKNEDEGGDDRDTWDNPIEFLLSCISMSVGLGNVWRFPGAAARNGGGAFLIPYIVVLLVIGRPMYYLDMCLGQFSRYGQVKVWNAVPMFKGVGYGAIIAVCAVASYYCALMAITAYFFFASFAKELPWGVCHPDKHPGINCTEDNLSYLYFNYTVHPQRPDIDDGLGKLSWQLSLCLVFSWLLVFLASIKGVKSSGKVAYFTAIFPYVVLFILLIRGVTLKGAWKGIRVFLEPQWKEILKPKVWYSAVEQCFFSLTAGFGPVIMFSSYNSFKQNIYKDALIISFMDTFTSLLAGVTIFSVIGNLMEVGGKEFDEIGGVGGPAVAFILYPQAITTFGSTPWPQIFAVLFFLMLFTLGLGSAISLAGGIITIICDQFPKMQRWMVTGIVCTIGCLAGLMYLNEGGMMMLDLIDRFGSGFVVYIMAMFQCAAISYVYGLSNWCDDIEFMLGRRPGIYWKLCWGFIIPVVLLANLLYFLISEPEFTSSGIPYPKYVIVCGWLLTSTAAAMIPAWAIHTVATGKADTLKEKFKLALKPTHRWGPQKPKVRKEWQEFRAMKKAEGSKKRFLIF